MFRRIAVLILLALAACSAPAATAPTVTPPATGVALPTLGPVGATILPSDRGASAPAFGATQEAAPATAVPTQPPPVTPVAAGFDFALRPQFIKDMNLVQNKTFYTIDLELNDDLTQVQGDQRIIFANRTGETLNEIYLRLFANYPDEGGSIRIDEVRTNGALVSPTLEAKNTALRIPLARPLAPNLVVPISLKYAINIPADNKTRYGDFTRTDWITTLPTVYPLVPAHDQAGWHIEVPPPFGDLVYAESSIYDVTITAPSAYTVIASGELVQETNNGARTTRRFIGAPMRDFDINLSDKLAKSSAQLDDITVNSYYQPEHVKGGQQALQWAVNAMRVYENRFGPYPFKELDVVESPTTAGGIEYPGVITVATNLYTDPGQTNFFEFATAHEVAHQWFYSAVGNDQVNHPWLDEALVQYATTVYFEDHYGKQIADNIRENYFTKQYEAAKQRYGDMPAGLPVSAYQEATYGAFVYAKAPKFFQAVRDQIGDEAFFKALSSYYTDFKFRIALPSDLVNAFNAASGHDITPLYEKWITS